jgi:hypothetical protein
MDDGAALAAGNVEDLAVVFNVLHEVRGLHQFAVSKFFVSFVPCLCFLIDYLGESLCAFAARLFAFDQLRTA